MFTKACFKPMWMGFMMWSTTDIEPRGWHISFNRRWR